MEKNCYLYHTKYSLQNIRTYNEKQQKKSFIFKTSNNYDYNIKENINMNYSTTVACRKLKYNSFYLTIGIELQYNCR